MEQWIHHRNRYLSILLDTESRPSSNKCSICYGHTNLKCPDCFGSPSYCRGCLPNAHRHSPFHRPLLWTATHYTQVSLQLLGFAFCLGHGGAPCPKTVEVSNSGNPLFTVVDWSSVIDLEIIFCVCSDGGDRQAQLLRSGLFPATFKQIETLFTVSVLDDFLIDNLECKTTAQQYYSKLQLITNKMFPNNVANRYKQLLRASRQWQDLKNRMESGIFHLNEGVPIPDGSMAIFCPACPQPGINLLQDWKTQYTPYVIKHDVTDWAALTLLADYHWDCTRSYLIPFPITARYVDIE
ncbi:hypothetical protein V8E53_007423 [Lactarius tabidus]